MLLYYNLSNAFISYGAVTGSLTEIVKDLAFTSVYLLIHKASDVMFNYGTKYIKNKEYMEAGEEFLKLPSDFNKFSFDEAMHDRIEHIVHDTLNISQSSFLLFYGPSGTGKTALSRHISQLLQKKYEKYKIFLVQGGVLAASNENVAEVDNLFGKMKNLVEEGNCVVLVIDECEAFFFADNGPSELVLSFLNLYDNVSDFAKSNLNTKDGKFTVLATCNEVNKIPEAVTRRGKQLYFNMCSKDIIVSIFRYFINNKIKVSHVKCNIDTQFLERLLEAALIDQDISGGNIKNVVEESFSYYLFLQEKIFKDIISSLVEIFKLTKGVQVDLKKKIVKKLQGYESMKAEEVIVLIDTLINNINATEGITEDDKRQTIARLNGCKEEILLCKNEVNLHIISLLKYWCINLISRISISDQIVSEDLFKRLNKMYSLMLNILKEDKDIIDERYQIDIKYIENSLETFKKNIKFNKPK